VYLKIKKLGVLSKLVTESNGKQILDELRCGLWYGMEWCVVWYGVWYGMIWCVVVWYGMVWYGMVWCVVVWCVVVCCSMVWCGMLCSVARYNMIWYGVILYSMVLYGIVWCGMTWYCIVKRFSSFSFSYHAQHSETASHSIHHIGMMALLHPALADICIEKLFSFLQSRDDSIVSHALAALRGTCHSRDCFFDWFQFSLDFNISTL
jgi:hypothetical protein